MLDLARFTGTELYHTYLLGCLLTDGALYLAKEAKCFWLMDAICSVSKTVDRVKREDFVVWTLKQGEESRAMLVADDGNGVVLYKQMYEYTTFPFDKLEEKPLKLYFENNVVCLPSER